MQRWGKHRATVARLAGIGAALTLLALLLAPLLPVSKKLWTGSFVSLTVGLDLVLLGATIGLVELRGARLGRGFLQMLGRNPLGRHADAAQPWDTSAGSGIRGPDREGRNRRWSCPNLLASRRKLAAEGTSEALGSLIDVGLRRWISPDAVDRICFFGRSVTSS